MREWSFICHSPPLPITRITAWTIPPPRITRIIAWTIPPTPSVEKFSSTKLVPGAKNVGDCCFIAFPFSFSIGTNVGSNISFSCHVSLVFFNLEHFAGFLCHLWHFWRYSHVFVFNRKFLIWRFVWYFFMVRLCILAWILFKWFCVPLKVSHLEAPNIHLSLINDTNYDYLAKGSSSFYTIEFYFFPHTHTFLINSKYRY